MRIFNYIKKNYSIIAIFIIALAIIYNIAGKNWKYENNIINWDVKSYYAYLPAAIIYKDLSFEFVYTNENTEFLRNNIWVQKLENGKKIVKTTMGMSYIYLPAFVVAHTVAEPLGYEANGFSAPYKVALNIISLLYLMLGLFYLRKILLLLKYRESVIFITIISIVLGTNLLFYSSIEPSMSHVFNFSLITIFLFHTIKWYSTSKIKHLIFLGLIGGLITLIRPTNIIVYFIFIFWNVNSITQIKYRVIYFIKNYKTSLLLILLFIIPWNPQLIFWKIQTGHLLFFSYGNDERFFFGNPQIFNILFSYWKGWYLYTPIMFVSTLGLLFLYKKNKSTSIIITIYLGIMIYILSSWWSWWFGGGFGNRAFIDFYGIMAIPYAAITTFFIKKRYINILYASIIILLIYLNIFQTKQYINGIIHYWGMTKELYWEQFLKSRKTVNFYNMLKIPDDSLAHKGIYKLVPIESKIDTTEIPASKRDDSFVIFNYNRKTKTDEAVLLNKTDYFNYSFNKIYKSLENNESTIKLFDRHRIHPKQYNDLLYCKAEAFLRYNIKEIDVRLNLFEVYYQPQNCVLVLSIENNGKTKFRKEKPITENEEILETIVIPENTLETDIIKVYVWQNSENKTTYRVSNFRLEVRTK